MNPRFRESGRGNRAYIICCASQIKKDSYIILTGQLYTDQSSLSSGETKQTFVVLSLDWLFLPEIFLVFPFYECHIDGVLLP